MCSVQRCFVQENFTDARANGRKKELDSYAKDDGPTRCNKTNGHADPDEKERKKKNEEAFARWVKSKEKRELEKKKEKKREEERRKMQKTQKEEQDKRIIAANREMWLQKKKAAIEAEKQKKKDEEKKLEEKETLKKNLSKEVVKVWMGISQRRPKPTPSSIFSNSQVNVSYKNPEPWRGVLDD
ncbi:coiled-coil domain-containing protein 34-like [Cimex lectularius]|uniref:Coiled-coil domain-containing protein n=1 Tax=Cimex lectularius TaxID=79782 RepID=A0A8I6S844_CIMLE|nr:coiled-coil domain-containing protein 34-like [Cimex lectularius]